MTVDFTDQEAALKDWALAGTGLDMAILENEERPFVDRAWVWFRIAGSTTEGNDSLEYFESGGELLPRVRGTRILSITIAIESDSQNPDRFALIHLEQLRAAARMPRLRSILSAEGLVFVDASDARNADAQIDDRFFSRFELDARFRWAFAIEGTLADDATSYIEKVNGQGTLNGGVIDPHEPALAVNIHPED